MNGARIRNWARQLAPTRLVATAAGRRSKIVALLLLLMLAAALSTGAFLGTGGSHKLASGAQSFLALMEQRSPGPRTGDELTKTKTAAGAEAAGTAMPIPSQFAPAVQPPRFGLVMVSLDAQPLANLPSIDLFSSPFLSDASFPPPFGGVPPPTGCCWGPGQGPAPPPGAGGGQPPVGPPGGGGEPPLGPPDPPIAPVTPVPEPDSWSMMLLGFFLIGWSVRNRGTARAPEAAGL